MYAVRSHNMRLAITICFEMQTLCFCDIWARNINIHSMYSNVYTAILYVICGKAVLTTARIII